MTFIRETLVRLKSRICHRFRHNSSFVGVPAVGIPDMIFCMELDINLISALLKLR